CHALTSPGRLRAMTAYFLLMPGIPMLFQGQEFGASSPFFFFADHEIGLSHDVREGRRLSLAQFPSLATSEMRAELADPGDIGMLQSMHCIATFWSCGARTLCLDNGHARSMAPH